MNHATLTNSPRLQRVFNLLKDGKPRTTRTIIREAHVCAVSAAVSEIRHQGHTIQCKRKGKYYYYSMEVER